MVSKRADGPDWQVRGQQFHVGQTVALQNGGKTDEGRVVAVWPAIGMVDVQFANTHARYPVEDLLIVNPEEQEYLHPEGDSVPGGVGSEAFVSDGPSLGVLSQENRIFGSLLQDLEAMERQEKSAQRVLKAFVKKALYWSEQGRKYRCTKSEFGSGSFICPRKACDGVLKPAIYKREDNRSIKLMGCPKCMFLIRRDDIIDSHCCSKE